MDDLSRFLMLFSKPLMVSRGLSNRHRVGFDWSGSAAVRIQHHCLSIRLARTLTDNVPCRVRMLHRSKILHGLVGLCRNNTCIKQSAIGPNISLPKAGQHTGLDFAESLSGVGLGM